MPLSGGRAHIAVEVDDRWTVPETSVENILAEPGSRRHGLLLQVERARPDDELVNGVWLATYKTCQAPNRSPSLVFKYTFRVLNATM